MSLLRIALGYPDDHRRGVPTVLYVGYNSNEMQTAINSAPAEVKRIETGSFHYQAPGRRQQLQIPAPAETAAQPQGEPAVSAPSDIAPSAAREAAEGGDDEGEVEDDEPLLGASEKKPKAKR